MRHARCVCGYALATVLGGLLVLACGAEGTVEGRPLVFVSVPPQRFVVQEVAGDLVRVEVMIPPGASPRTYEPTLSQMQAFEKAAMYVKVGHPNFPFEKTWLDRLLRDAPKLRVVDASSGLELREGDPHVWLAPAHVAHMAGRVASGLEEVLADEEEQLRENLEAFRERVAEVDRRIARMLADAEGEEFFVFHPAWGYFAEAYGLRQVAIEHDHKEPDPREMADLIERVRDAKAAVIFVQPQFDATSARTIARETRARVEVLDPLAEDWDENLIRAARALAEGMGS